MTYDAIIVGGGPAGLSAALVLGRSRRRVLVCDSGHYRNAASSGVHGFLTRDGTPPAEMLRLGREQLEPYGVEVRDVEVKGACTGGDGFLVTLPEGAPLCARKLLIATGVKDRVPEIPGIHELYGTSVHHCPYCDGWEWRDQPLAVYGRKHHGYALARGLLNWSEDVVLLTDGRPGLTAKQRTELGRLRVPVNPARVTGLEGSGGRLSRILFEDGSSMERRALFFSTGQDQCCDLAVSFGCEIDNKGAIKTNLKGDTNIPGLYVVGDASHDVQFVIVAAAEGAKAGVAINEALTEENQASGR